MNILLSALLAVSAFSATPAEKARAALRSGLLAHIEGDAPRALAHWRRCLMLAPERTQERADCDLYEDMYAASLPADAPGTHPASRRAFRQGAKAYRGGDLRAAARLWREGLAAAPEGSRDNQDNMTALALVRPAPSAAAAPAPAAPAPAASAPRTAESDAQAKHAFMTGMILYQKGDDAGAEASMRRCLSLAVPGGGNEQECKSFLEFLATRRRR